MNATRKFRMLSTVLIVLSLLLGISLNPAHAQGRGKEIPAAPGRDPSRLGQIAGQVSTRSGWFSIIWGDSRDGKSSMIYTLTGVKGQRTLLQLDEEVAKKLGGVLKFNGKYVTVEGTLATPSDTGAPSDSIQSAPAVLNVISISLAAPPGSEAPTIIDVTPLAVVSGSKPWVSIMCKFSDVADEPEDLAYFQGMYGDTQPGLNHYWKELSFNTADVAGSTTGTGWYTLANPVVHYNPTLSPKGANKAAVATDCIAAADATVDFSLYDGINMMFNFNFDYGWAWGGTWTDTLDGVTKTWSITWEPPWAYSDISVIAHEMGHGFGLPHSTAIDRDPDHVYDNAWDVMSWDRYNCAAATDPTYGCMAQHTIAIHKGFLGWIPGPQIIFVPPPVSSTTLTLEDLAAPTSGAPDHYQIAIILIGGSLTNFYTLEARRFTGYDAKLPGEAVIIHNVDTTEGIPALLAPGGLSSTDPGVMWTVGETFHDATNNITVIVNSATAAGFEVTILNGNNSPISEAGGPYTEECAGSTTTVALDGTGSSDPEGFALTYSWSTNCPGGTFNDSTIAQPTLTVDTSPGCGVGCTVSLTVTDNQGLSSVSDATVTIQDTTPPVITCPVDTTIECDASSDPSNTGTATATDICNPDPSINYVDSSTPGSCPQASTIPRFWIATDICGNAAICVQTIHIVDTTPPVLSPQPADVTVECDAPVPPPPIVTATDNCDSSVPTNFSEQRIDGSCPSNYTLIRTWSATDDCGNTATHSQTITVLDTTPPVIHNVAATPNVIWPPNHKMVHVAVTAIATDNCDPAPHCDITSVNSNEPINGPGDGNTAPDWIITGDLTVDLRAERSGRGNGRIYTITVTCTDTCGNSSVGETTVTVPHDQKKK